MNILIILGMGAAGWLPIRHIRSGRGFRITPHLSFYNIQPVAVATANHVVASSVSEAMTHFRRGT